MHAIGEQERVDVAEEAARAIERVVLDAARGEDEPLVGLARVEAPHRSVVLDAHRVLRGWNAGGIGREYLERVIRDGVDDDVFGRRDHLDGAVADGVACGDLAARADAQETSATLVDRPHDARGGRRDVAQSRDVRHADLAQ